MHHIPIDDHRRIGHPAVPRVLTYLLLVALGLVGASQISPALVGLLTLAMGLVLALMVRMDRLGRPGRGAPESPSGLPLGDGGAFPGGVPVPRHHATVSTPTVLDGGSLRRRRIHPARTTARLQSEPVPKSPSSKLLNESPSH